MDLQLRDKVAVVTGGSRGIGFGIAAALAREGCRLALCARGEDDLRRAAAELQAEHGAEVLAMPLDVAEPDSAKRLLDATAERFGGVDVLVNNAGGGLRKRFEEATEEDWSGMLELNFRSAVRMSRVAVPHLRRRGGGAILFVASIWGRESAPPGLSLYVTTKAAMIAVAKSMAAELAPDGIRVLSVAPGSIRFPGRPAGRWRYRPIAPR